MRKPFNVLTSEGRQGWWAPYLRFARAPAGQSPACVERQLAHASIRLTVDTYGQWLPMGNKPATGSTHEVVAKW